MLSSLKNSQENLLTYRFLHLDLINSDTEKLVSEILVIEEFIIIIDIFATWHLLQDSRFATSQGL